MKIDGRKLTHAKLQEIRFKAVKPVQAAQAPTTVAGKMGLDTNPILVWLATYGAGGWDALRSTRGTGGPHAC